ncbi:MAG: alpha/beta fold hydrolase [Saprospiraceae bacterium]|nr:alpha/beta fold hydrolase [Saprospiraceae bacterium]
MLKAIKIGGSACIIIALILVFFGNKIIENIIFRPIKLAPSHIFNFEKQFEEFNVQTEPDVNINFVRFKTANPKGAILYFHGNKDNLQRWGGIASELGDYGYDVFVIDYRGYGKSTGTPSESGMLKDAKVIFEHLNKKYAYQNWIFYGRSLGSGVAAYLASIHAPYKLILETPYYSMEDLITYYYYPYRWHQNKICFPTNKYLAGNLFPVLILHGTDDRVIPNEQGKKLFLSLGRERVKMIHIKHGNHHNLSDFSEYWFAIESFLSKK